MEDLAIEKHKILEAIDHEVQILITDGDGAILYVNESFCSISGYNESELIGHTYWLLNENLHSKSFFKSLRQTLSYGKTWQGEVKNRSKDGVAFWESVIIIPLLNDNGFPDKFILVSVVVNKLKQTEAILEEAFRDSFQETIKHLENTIFKYIETSDGRLVFTLSEGKIAEKIGLVTKVVANHEIKEFFPEDVRPVMEKNFRTAIQGKPNKFEMRLFDTDFLVYLSPIIENGQVLEVIGTVFDITEQKKTKKLINDMTYHDSLMDLLNRSAFNKKMTEIICRSKKYQETFAVLFIDLDGFKNINDTLGHQMGDRLLSAVSDRIGKSIDESDFIARIGDDECAILLPNRSKVETQRVAEHIIKQFSDPFILENNELYITPSIGISLFPQDGESGETLLNNADKAMHHVKEQGKNSILFFSDTSQNKKSLLENDLRIALEKEQFILYYQPQIDISTNKLFGVEALIRWKHPQKGIVPPLNFISVAEETDLIIPIGEWVLQTACRQNKEWQRQGYEPIVISVNVSPQQFMKKDFVNLVHYILQETNLEPQYLELEITEGMMMNVGYAKNVLKSLRKLGVKVSIDDFGTGYSSLNYLSKLPINKLKIDKSFIRKMNEKNKAIVKTIILLAKNLDMDVIAEGVETSEHVNFLKNQSCNQVQGYFFSKPLPEKELVHFFTKQSILS